MLPVRQMLFCARQRRYPQRVSLKPNPIPPCDRCLKAVPLVSKSRDVIARYPSYGFLLACPGVCGAHSHGCGFREHFGLRFEAENRIRSAVPALVVGIDLSVQLTLFARVIARGLNWRAFGLNAQHLTN